MNAPRSLSSCSSDAWDEFLRAHPEGQFQQSAAWARVKALEGWTCERRVVLRDGAIAGGFQLLWKPSRLGRIGYVSKGPVVAHGVNDLGSRLAEGMTRAAGDLKLRALIAQPPDSGSVGVEDLIRRGFFRHPVPSVISATAIVPIGEGPDAVIAGLSSNARREWRTASKRGAVFRWGTRADLATFFGLMCISARRQHGVPNPSSLSLLESLWDALSPHVSLGIADYQGAMNAAALVVRFGTRLTVWKVGWSGEHPEVFGNCFVNTEVLLWGAGQGDSLADFVSIDPTIARTLLEGRELTEVQNRSKDKFHLKLGAKPVLLPPALLYTGNPVVRLLLRAVMRCPPVRRAIMARIRS